jgi:hypothetical protein
MARVFRKMSCEFNGPPIFFLPPSIYKLDKPFKGAKYIYTEPMIDTSKWERRSNNGKFCCDQLMASFSHFSNIASGGYFLVCDL